MAFTREFYQLFLIREGKELAGKHLKNVLALFTILLMTFLAIGFGEGGLEYLEVKMSNPFYKWVNVRLPDAKSDSANYFIQFLNNDSLKREYQYVNILSYAHFNEDFFTTKGDDIPVEGRVIEAGDSLLKGIWDQCLIKGKSYDEIENYFGKKNVGLIVTKSLLLKLGYEDIPAFLYLSFSLVNNDRMKVPLPVVAVVKQLPGMVAMMATPMFYYETGPKQDYSFDISAPEHKKYLLYFLPSACDPLAWLRKISGIINRQCPGIIERTFSEKYDKSVVEGNSIRFELDEDHMTGKNVNADDLDSVIMKNLSHEDNPLIRIYRYSFSSIYRPAIKPDYLSVYFSHLDSISQFQVYLERNFDLKIELSQVESKNNFTFISKLTKITSFFLIIFSIISVSMFLSNIIRSHFERVKKNIGTFKAFGLNNRKLLFIYTTISFVFVMTASVTSYAMAYILGYSGAIKFILGKLHLTIEKSYIIFNLLTELSLYTFIVIISLSTFIVILQLLKLLAYTPGDLIYDRK
jgi:ABC-type antimicrobial peptide transport system permease subunit